MKKAFTILLLLASPALAQPNKPAPAAKLTSAQVQQNPATLLQQFTLEDLQAALADAQAQNPPDMTAINCYQALIPIIQTGVGNPLPKGPGVFQAAQKVRDAKAQLANLQSPTGPLAQFNQACAAYILDAQNTIIGLGAALGIVIGSPIKFPLAIP